MKKIMLLLSVLTVLLVSSCADKTAYTITGKVANSELNGKQVYLQVLNEDRQGFTATDTAVIENGTFVFKGKAEAAPVIKFISLADAPYLRPALIIIEAGNIEMTVDTVSSIKGSPLNDKYQEFANQNDKLSKDMRALGVEYNNAMKEGTLTPEKDEELNSKAEGISNQMTKLAFDFTKANIKNPVGEFFFLDMGGAFTDEQFKELLGEVNPTFKEKPQIQHLVKQLEARESTIVGKQFVDIKGKTPDEKDIALSDYAGKGNIVLIDFWASWCGPCVKEMPIVVEAYKNYKAKGFEIVGVSLDQDKEAWEKAIKNLNITWPQMSDLQGWKSELAAAYGVNSIPHTVLLDKDGKIIERNLRGEELLTKLGELLK